MAKGGLFRRISNFAKRISGRVAKTTTATTTSSSKRGLSGLVSRVKNLFSGNRTTTTTTVEKSTNTTDTFTYADYLSRKVQAAAEVRSRQQGEERSSSISSDITRANLRNASKTGGISTEKSYGTYGSERITTRAELSAFYATAIKLGYTDNGTSPLDVNDTIVRNGGFKNLEDAIDKITRTDDYKRILEMENVLQDPNATAEQRHQAMAYLRDETLSLRYEDKGQHIKARATDYD